MAMKKSLHKETRWRALVSKQTTSGLSVRQFCQQERISEPSFYAWRRELRLRDQQANKNGKAREPVSSDGESKDFVAVKIVDSSSPSTMELVHPTGYLVRVIGEVNSQSLKQVLDLLDAQGS